MAMLHQNFSIVLMLLRIIHAPTSHAFLAAPPQQTLVTLRRLRYSRSSVFQLQAKPKQGSKVDSYQTVSVNCSKCRQKLFRYKKKNGTKSNLIKLYVERISEDCTGLLSENGENNIEQITWTCPNCQSNFARPALIHGRPALKLVGGKVRMTKK